MIEIIHSDCLQAMRNMEANSIDFIVTDPPYGVSFMGKHWDRGIPSIEHWQEMLRIVKPGGHICAAGLPRMMHRLISVIEDAGWEIRDLIMHLFGTGFPKSLNVSKSIDKQRNDDPRPICRFLRNEIEKSNKTFKEIAEHFKFNIRMIEHWAAKDTDSQPLIPTNEQWLNLKKLISFSDKFDNEVIRLNHRKNTWGENAFLRGTVNATGGLHGGSGNTVGCYTGKQLSDNPVSELAKTFDGYGTALKPAWEGWCLAMKPLDGTFAQNAEKWGVAGINIDESRISCEKFKSNQSNSEKFKLCDQIYKGYPHRESIFHSHKKGRWPANLILDEEAAEELDQMTGNNVSRFFYCAKTSSSERNRGLEDLPLKESPWIDRGTYSEGRNPVIGERSGEKPNPRQNNHPTVKPIALMKFILKLLAPPGNPICLDPFCGSGSTLVAAKELGISCIGIEKEEEYVKIAQARVDAAKVTPEQLELAI